jgi:hypothetical protein
MFKGRVYGLEQRLFPEGFVQKVHRTGLERPRSRVVISMRRDEDDRNPTIDCNQLTLETESTHARHSHIKNQARRIVQLIRIQERFRRRKTLHPKSDGSDQIVQRIPQRVVIVYNRNKGNSRHAVGISLPQFTFRLPNSQSIDVGPIAFSSP